MQTKIKRILSMFIVIVIALLSIGIIGVKASGFSIKDNELIEEADIISGIHYVKKSITSTSDDSSSSTFETCFLEVNKGAADVVSWAITGKDGLVFSSVKAIAEDYENSHPGKVVIAAINDDYFGSNNGAPSTRDPLVIDGKVINASPDKNAKNRLYIMGFNEGWALKEGVPYLLSNQGESIEVSEDYYLDIYQDSEVVETITLEGLNTYPSKNGTTFTVESNLSINQEQVFPIVTQTNENLSNTVCYENTQGDVYYIVGKIDTNTVNNTKDNTYNIVTNNSDVIEKLKSCTKVNIYKKPAGKYEGYTSVFACQQPTMKDGRILEKEEIVDYGSHRDIRRARTTIGFKEDGSICLLTVDEYNTKSPEGACLRECANIMKSYGCVTSFNLDGGGSSCMYVSKNGVLTLCNVPSDGAPRSVGNAILIVKDDKTEENINCSITNITDSKVSAKVTYNGDIADINSVTLHVNKDTFDLALANNAFEKQIDLTDGTHYDIYLEVSYKSVLGIDRIYKSTSSHFFYHIEKTPSDFKVVLDELDSGEYNVSITCNDNGADITYIGIIENGNETEFFEGVTVTSTDISLVCQYKDAGKKTIKLNSDEFELIVNKKEKETKSGCNNAFSLVPYLLALILTLLSLSFIRKNKD